MQAALVLRQRMSGYLVDEGLQSLAPLLDEAFVKDALVAAEGHLPLPCLSWEWWHHNLRGYVCS